MAYYRLGRPIVTAVLASYAAYSALSGYWAFQFRPVITYTYLVWAAISGVAAFGVYKGHAWSRFFVYAIALAVTGAWLFYTLRSVVSGVFAEASGSEVAIALFPSVAMVTVAMITAWMARCEFVTRGV